MAKIDFIGNLGSDARVETANGRQFVAFNVADTNRFTDADGTVRENTTWISCTLNGDGGKLLQYLKKGKTVFVRGFMSTRVFNSAKHRCMMAGVNCAVQEIELVGGAVRDVPKQLNDEKGLLFDIYQAFYIDPSIEQKPSALYDTTGGAYRVDSNGFVYKVVDPNADGQSEANETSNSGDNDVVY